MLSAVGPGPAYPRCRSRKAWDLFAQGCGCYQIASEIRETEMRAGGCGIALLLLAAAAQHGSAGEAGPTRPQSLFAADNRPPMSSQCLAACSQLQQQCEEFEKRHPSCSTDDICYEENLQCEARCHATVPRA